MGSLSDLIKQIVQENNSIYKRYQLSEIDVVYETNGIYYICEKGGGDCKGSSRKRWIVKKSKLSME